MNERLCSVIIPAFNAADFLSESIDSALAQTYRPLEVVVVDDGSTDATAAIVAGYGDRVVAVRQENRGLAGARNAGLAAAAGEVVALLDADDAWPPERLAVCTAVLDARPDVDLVTTDAYLVDGSVRTARRFYGDLNPPGFPAADGQLREIAVRNFVFVGAVIRRSVLRRTGGFDEQFRRAEDYDLWIRLLLDGSRFALVADPLAWYRLRPDSLSADAAAQWEAHLAVLAKHLPVLWGRGVHALPTVYFDLARRAAAGRDVRVAARWVAMGLRLGEVPRSQRVRAAAATARSLVSGRY